MRGAAITVDGVDKFFPPTRSGWRALLQPFEKHTCPALCGFSLEVREGESVALLGTNGAGKSTLLRILATLLLPTKGCARVAGFDTRSQSSEVRRSLGYHAGRDHGFYPRLTARQNLVFFARLNQLTSSRAEARIAQLAMQFQLEEVLDRQVRTLSSGTVQRLSLVRAVLHEPGVLLLDEPTRSLDVLGAGEFRRFLKSEVLRGGTTTLLFASHTLPEVELLANRIAIIDAGRLLACDTLTALLRRTGAATLEDVFLRVTGRGPQPRPEAVVSPGAEIG
ncbi:MAG TPA: ABC transporter ATP-binding protein [Candidatus Acidoferrum sp.]|nr:ABC transporter ATP-binding protein [Candidatus Acidoferrum sp.]